MDVQTIQKRRHSSLRRFYWYLRRGGLSKYIKNQFALYLSSLRAQLSKPLPQANIPDQLGARAYEHVRAVVELGERYPNSPGWRKQLDYICAKLESMDLKPIVDRWHDTAEGLDFQNISVTIPGRDKRRIIIAAHHDTKKFAGHPVESQNFHFLGANDGGSGVGLLLALAETLRLHDNQLTLQLVFFDGEESVTVDWNNAERALFGSRRFVNHELKEHGNETESKISAVIVIDMVGCSQLQIDDDANSDNALKNIFRRAALDLGFSKHFFQHRLPIDDDHLPFLEAGIPAIDLIQKQCNPYWHTPKDILDNVSDRSLQMVAAVVLTALPEIADRITSSKLDLSRKSR